MIRKIEEYVKNVTMLESTIKMAQRCTRIIINDLLEFGHSCDIRNACYFDIHRQAHTANLLPNLYFKYETICFDEGNIEKSYQLSRSLVKDIKENHKFKKDKHFHSTDKMISKKTKLLFNHVQRTYYQYLVFKEHLSNKIMCDLEIELQKVFNILNDPEYKKMDRNDLFSSWISDVENTLEIIKDNQDVLKLQGKEYDAELDLIVDYIDNI